MKDGREQTGELSVLCHGVHTTAHYRYSCGLAATAVGLQLSAGAKFCAFCECTHSRARQLGAADDFSLIGYHSNWYCTGCLVFERKQFSYTQLQLHSDKE